MIKEFLPILVFHSATSAGFSTASEAYCTPFDALWNAFTKDYFFLFKSFSMESKIVTNTEVFYRVSSTVNKQTTSK